MADAEMLWPLSVATRTAEELKLLLEPACLRIEVAGSIRRLRPAVKDIDLVAIPKIERITVSAGEDLFGERKKEEEYNLLWKGLDGYLKTYLKKGDKNRAFNWPASNGEGLVKVDLWACDVSNWGLIYLIRTGSQAYAKHVVGGALRGQSLCSVGGRIYHLLHDEPVGEPVSVPDERDLCRLAKVKWLPPAERSWE